MHQGHRWFGYYMIRTLEHVSWCFQRLHVEQTYQGSKVIPDFRDVRVQTDRAGVRIKGVSVLIDLVVKDAYRTPKSWVSPVTVNGLLVSIICFRILLLGHVTSAKQVPTLRIVVV